MRFLATIKHISSKNADYGVAERYLLHQHDELRNKPILDAEGHLIPREAYRMDTLLCGEEDFAIACMKANLHFEKNNRKGDVKSHHYIISFDSRDREGNGLTLDRAQALCKIFCQEHFPGHPALIVTHPEGHNHSGNIHTHIVINSLRVQDVPRQPYMDRAYDGKAGMKHRCTAAFLRYLRSEVMRMCQREGLHQIDLLKGSEERISDREYRANQRGQMKAPSPTKFETEKESLRKILRAALNNASSLSQFRETLRTAGVELRESRGRFSYRPENRTQPITARRLGNAYTKEAVLKRLQQNAQRQADREVVLPVQHLIDLEGKSGGYLRWSKLYNLKQMANARLYFVEHGFDSPEVLENAIIQAETAFQEKEKQLKEIDLHIDANKELQRQIGLYRQTLPIRRAYTELTNEKKKQAFYQQHSTDLALNKSAAAYLKAHGIGRLPALAALQAELEALVSQSNAVYQDYCASRAQWLTLCRVRENILHALRRDQLQNDQPSL